MCFYIDDKLLLIKSILKMHFQSAYNQYQPLFSNKAILQDCPQYKRSSVQSEQSVVIRLFNDTSVNIEKNKNIENPFQ